MNIDLAKPELLPEEFWTELQGTEALCRSLEFFEELLDHRDVISLVCRLNEFCMARKIIGVHFTRSVPEHIKKLGLLVRSGNDIRQTFLDEYSHLFTADEMQSLKEQWERCFTTIQARARDNKIFFNFTESSLYDGSAKYLVGLYGGEQVAMGFEMDHPVGVKLGKIGSPLVIRCALDPHEVNTCTPYPWGKILVSSYHKKINSGACIFDQDGYQSVPVSPDNIVEIKALIG